ncbi:hypothetical protein LH991_13730 [Schleiferilactobacillus harbinensis]|uniref:DUF5590 domain-containing protein n=2 Tax=Schleiferilactobacillus harbinensis TaxID=304207 RepID=A0A5P2TVS9_9LACO|nr:PepSY domain-containing protein [Schleiferilactobacillus harbinensis]HAY52965.1 hypothetical protein [Lactobacillus sp.]KRM26122.1 hypothetical protein FC91_GL000190 [Schleiferilactobacillus harbinensis DSM 16991]MBO3092057.1 DUF5590 domain-containing protein [Schleiferilactobacillus harbinensis]MCT2909351.1 hypothetical protein [Schleiferilactobacillus harbinensis]QEU46618.1 hypothetical protein FMM01_04560 [Schleiferilactobacillus harbinensis]
MRSSWQKWAYWGTMLIIVATILSIYFVATAPRRNAENQARAVAERVAGVTEPQVFYLFNRNETDYTIGGKQKSGRRVFVIINAKSGKTRTLAASGGLSASAATAQARAANNQAPATKVALGLYKGTPAWEVTLRQRNGSYRYVLLNFKTGETVKAS